MLCHHCANEPHRSWILNTLVLRPKSPVFHMVHNTTNTDGAFDPTFLGYPSLPWFKYEILCCKGFYIDIQAGCVSLATVWRRLVRTDSTHFSLPKSICSLSSSSPSLQSITTATATQFPSNQPFTFWLATENPHSPFVACPLNPLAFSLTWGVGGRGEGRGVKICTTFVTCRRKLEVV